MKALAKSLIARLAYQCGNHNRAESHPRLWTLMYHRILPAKDPGYASEEPGMVITPETFEMHMREVMRLFTPVDLEDWIDRSLAGTALPVNACAITFDDGWLDNYQYAFPILQKYRIPFTTFLVADRIGSHYEFWPNRIMNMARKGGLAKLKDLSKHSNTLETICKDLDFDTPNFDAVYLIEKLKQLPDQQINTALDSIPVAASDNRSLMNASEIAAMISTGLCHIGSHTCNHIRLMKGLDPALLQREVVTSKSILEAMFSTPVSLFCYPNGEYSNEAKELVAQNYKAAVTTKRGVSTVPAIDFHAIPRLGLHNDVSNTRYKLAGRLSMWL